MKIVADTNLYGVQTTFERIGELVLVPGRELNKSHLKDAEALLVRSITRVDADLLEASSIKFVGTFTSGADHIDNTYLENKGIAFADAKGSNANAVVDYCFAALAYCIKMKSLVLEDCKVGIVGGGHVGGLFAEKLRRLNVEVLICDPPLQDSVTEPALEKYCPIEAIMQCDVVSLHVPLTKDNEHATYGLLNFERLSTLPQSALLINTCRGSVVDENALVELLNQRPDLTCIVDVWENEPVTNSALVQKVDIATPHIAGYSMEAKRTAMVRIFEQIQKKFGLPVQSQTICEKDKEVKITGKLKEDPWAIVLELFPLCSLSEKFKESHKHENIADAFDQLRRNMVGRREFNEIMLPGTNLTEMQRVVLQVLGVKFY